MALNNRILIRALLAGLVVASVGLTACGRKGALELPPRAAISTAGEAPAEAPPPKPNRRFILDPLL